MGLIFHDGTNPVLKGYASLPWNDPQLIGNAGNFGGYNTPANIRKILAQSKTTSYTYWTKIGKEDREIEVDFQEIANHPGEPNAFVVKGVHQFGPGIPAPHISIAFEGYIYHLEMLEDSKKGLVILNITRGQKYADPEGWRQR